MNEYDNLSAVELTIPDDATVAMIAVGSTSGYDGHCLRAYSYFSEQMPDIDPKTVAGINSIKYSPLLLLRNLSCKCLMELMPATVFGLISGICSEK